MRTGDRIALKRRHLASRRAVVVRADHPLAVVHLEVLEEEPLVASRNPATVAEVVRAELEVLHALRLPRPYLREVVVLLRRHHAEAHVVRIRHTLAARRLAVARVGVGVEHDVGTDRHYLLCNPVPEVYVAVREIDRFRKLQRALVVSLRTVERPALLAAAEAVAVIRADVVVFGLSGLDILRDDDIHNILV